MRIEGSIQGQALNISTLSEIVNRLNVGDIIRAQVLEILSDELLLKLFDGTMLKAAALADMEAGKGEFANFIVKDKTESQLFLEELKNNTAKSSSLDTMLLKQLAAAGVEATQQNIEIGQKLNSNFVPFRKELFENILEMLKSNQGLNSSEAVFLAANKLTANENNINALKQLVDAKMQVGNEIAKLTSLLTDAENSTLTASPVKPALPQNMNAVSGEDILNLMEEGLQENKNPILADLIKGFDLKGKIAELVQNTINHGEGEAAEGLNQFFKSIPAMLRPRERGVLADFINNLGSNLKGSPSENQELREITKSENFNEVKQELEKLFVKVDSHSLEKNLEMKETYKELYHKLEVLKENLATAAFPGRDEVMQRVENLQNHLRFINDINGHNTYVQIPLNLGNKNTTGELYILKRESKRKKINPENVTMLIALNTQNIGRIESLVTVNQKNIALSVRVEDPQIIGFFKDNYKELYNRMNEKDYKLVDVKYRLMEQPLDVLNANEVVTQDLSQGRKSVDVRI